MEFGEIAGRIIATIFGVIYFVVVFLSLRWMYLKLKK